MLRTRQPNRRRFKSSLREGRRRKREYYYSAVTVLVVKIILFFFLGALFNVSLKLFNSRFSGSPVPVRFSIPIVVVIAAIILIKYIYRDIKELRELSKEKD